MMLHDVNRDIVKHKKLKRVGRGPGSGHGKTSGRGHKGQGQLAGWSAAGIFEGGRMPLIRRIPKRGFNNQWADLVHAVNVGELNKLFKDGDEVTVEKLRTLSIAKGTFDQLKVLGDGEITKKLKVTANSFSKTAQEKIEKAGGSVTVLPGKKAVAKNKMGSKKKAAEQKAAAKKKK